MCLTSALFQLREAIDFELTWVLLQFDLVWAQLEIYKKKKITKALFQISLTLF